MARNSVDTFYNFTGGGPYNAIKIGAKTDK